MSTFSDIFASGAASLLAIFGESATYYPRAGDSYAITLVFDSGEQVQNTKRVYQTAWAPLTSFSAEPVKADKVVLNGVTYLVSDIEKDSQACRLLTLSVTNPI